MTILQLKIRHREEDIIELEIYLNNYLKNKKVAVLGVGISNRPLIGVLLKYGAKITAFDKKSKDSIKDIYYEIEKHGVEFSLGAEYLKELKGFDIIFRSPGIRPDLPEILEEIQRGAVLTSEMELFLELCPAKVIGVTGSSGKTTTTTLIYKMLREEGYTCWLGGNIGTPLIDKLDEIKEDHKVVVELSSFQLMTLKKSPSTAIITNITPNHLDMHTSMDEYVEAKKNIFKFQQTTDRVILNLDDEISMKAINDIKGELFPFSFTKNAEFGVFYINGKIVIKSSTTSKAQEYLEATDICIPGDHNIENYMTAIAAVFGLVSPKSIRNVARNFYGVEYRNELVRELDGVKFYNSSIDSSPQRTIATLKCFSQKVILIAGGKDKKIPYDELGPVLLERVKCLVLVGQTSEVILNALAKAANYSPINIENGEDMDLFHNEKAITIGDINVFKCETYEDAVAKAWLNAKKGDVVLLSPASTSFDMFNNFEERGMKFIDVVNKL